MKFLKSFPQPYIYSFREFSRYLAVVFLNHYMLSCLLATVALL